MYPILFYGVPEGCSFGSIVALEWSGLPYQLCRIDMPDVVSSEAYRRINPVAETPSLRTADGRQVHQSIAILQHIGAQSPGSGLVPPQGTPGFDHFNEVLAFLNTDFFESFSPLWYAMEHCLEGSEQRTLTTMGRHKVRKVHADLERMLGARPWLAGGQRTAADAYFMGIARWNDFHQVLDRRDFPALHDLHERLKAEPAVHFAHAVEHGEAARSGGAFLGHVALHDVLEGTTAPS
ncbi:glutathione S-transferase family protein [Hydrogenophaga laconesensis]|uniref:Glutathione S-transferase n=1 Tax=Hydrogenophaga laconesensis TaxID=1805971 RepID=A0ABU1V8K3_9BURK|nr:glutathione S-transferase family protein [Hydrogenophaga laconesensis]MDR7093653.1 glutathione S-transferase [Hydrogenophaga laconesensis]